MKSNTKKSMRVLGSASLLLASGFLLIACASESGPALNLKVLDAPSNVKLVLGDDEFLSVDDYVTFDTVENATSYQVYVYKQGDEKAKVTIGESSPIYLASPLAAGDYLVSVLAVGDGVNYKNSNGSEPLNYNLKQGVVTPLAAPSSASIDFKTGKLSFTGSAKASQYSVFIYNSTKDATSISDDAVPLTQFVVPGDITAKEAPTVEYSIPDTVTKDLVPGYYMATIQAKGDEALYTSDSELFISAVLPNVGYTLATPTIKVSQPDNGGILVEVENHLEYYVGTEFKVKVFASSDATEPIKTETLRYTSSTSFGRTNYNNSIGIEVKDAAGEGELAINTEYFISVGIDSDGVLYTNSPYSAKTSITCTKAGKGTSGGGNQGGGPGGPGGGDQGGGGGGATLTFGSFAEFELGASSITVNITAMTTPVTLTGTLKADTTYIYDLAGKGGMGEDVTGTFTMNTDNSCTLEVKGFGPFSDQTWNGTWAVADNKVTVTIA